MIDLHMHSQYSDGTDTVTDILQKGNEKKLEIISLTDHNSCKGYIEMETMDIDSLFQGRIICGCEFTTTFDQRLIEVLGYGFDYKKVQEYLDAIYNEETGTKNVQILFHRLVSLFDQYHLQYDIQHLHYPMADNDFFEISFYEEVIRYPENLKRIDEDIFATFSDFFRKGLANPKSKLFLNAIEFKPSIHEIIHVIHEAGGIAFLAHPYQYKFPDTEEFLDKLVRETELDGLECFYTTFTDEQSDYLVHFVKEHHLLMSGGSDYHGTNKKNHDLGCGKGNLSISKEIIQPWPISFYK